MEELSFTDLLTKHTALQKRRSVYEEESAERRIKRVQGIELGPEAHIRMQDRAVRATRASGRRGREGDERGGNCGCGGACPRHPLRKNAPPCRVCTIHNHRAP